MDDLSLGNVRPFDRPMTAGPNDRFVGRDDMGNKVYETVAGKRYSVRPATEDESQTTRAKVEGWVDEGAPLPSWEQITDTMKAVPGAVYDSAQRSLSGDASLGELMGFAGASSAPGVASRVGTAMDPSVVSAMGATHKVPRYKQKPLLLEDPVVKGAPTPEQPETFNDEGFLQIDEPVQAEREFVDADTFFGLNPENPFVPTYFPPPKEEFLDTPFIQFRDPLEEILSEMEIPSKGITGAQLLKELQDNPTVRMAQLRSQGILDRIDPAKRYGPVDQVRPLLLEGKYTVQAVPQNRYDSYQRQPVADKELNYVEYAINADTDGPKFRANYQHYQDNTLAHVRLSERENPAGNYVLIEELQSDLLQKGFVKPTPGNFDRAAKAAVDTMIEQDYPLIPRAVEQVTYEDFKVIKAADFDQAVIDDLGEKYGIFDDAEYAPFRDFIYRLEGRVDNFIYDTRLPPIAKMEGSVRLGLETAIAHAAQNNIERVVIPPFHRIVEQRFTKGSAEYDKAMDPKSGFYQTYVGAVNKVLKKFNEEGIGFEVREFDLSYKNSDQIDRAAMHIDVLTDSQAMALVRILGEQKPLSELTRQEQVLVGNFTFKLQQRVDPSFTFESYQESYNKSPSLYTALYNTLQITDVTDPALEINFSNAIKNNYDLTRPRFAEGGVVENNTPVPPGATPKEVADDVPIMASEGEYVIPANVVRFLGLDKIEKMVEQAKTKLAELDQKGRIGGDTGEDDDLPFSPEELQRAPAGDVENVGAVPQMAEGGLVGNNQDPNMQIDPATGLPLWLLQMQGQSQAPAPTPTVTSPPVAPSTAYTGPSMKRESDRDRDFQVNLAGTAQSVAKWSPAEFNKYARTRGNTGQALGSAVTSMVPFGGIGARMRGNYLERAVPRGFDTMLETGRDLQGNPLTADQITELRTSYDRVQNTAKPRTGAVGALRGLAEDTGLVRRRETTAEREPRRLRDVFSGGSGRSSSPKASGDGLVSRPNKKKESGGQKTSTNSTNGKTSSKKK